MSWSTIHFGGYWAHAHDNEQMLFMSLAPEFIDQSPEFNPIQWLQEWKAFWVKNRDAQGNGCSDIALERFLIDAGRIRTFREFLASYKDWLSAFGEEIPTDAINGRLDVSIFYFTRPLKVDKLLQFASTIVNVLDGNVDNKIVHKKQSASAQPAAPLDDPATPVRR